MNYQNIQEYIVSEEASYKTTRIPLTDNKDWNMYQHIQRCKNVANAWYHTGADDGNRPYDDLVTPIINVAFRTEGFDVKDIVRHKLVQRIVEAYEKKEKDTQKPVQTKFHFLPEVSFFRK
jgi:hypothetical protein